MYQKAYEPQTHQGLDVCNPDPGGFNRKADNWSSGHQPRDIRIQQKLFVSTIPKH